MTVIDAAKGIMRQSGNLHQWREGYPSEAVITADMEKNGGFVVEDDGKVVGYFRHQGQVLELPYGLSGHESSCR